MPERARQSRNPLAAWRLVDRLIIGLGVVLTIGLGVWAVWPVTEGELGMDFADLGSRDTSPVELHRETMLDRDVFIQTAIWNPPDDWIAQAKKATEEPEKQRPEKRTSEPLRLVGIVEEGGVRYAALYDPERDELLIVAAGDQIRGYRVDEITNDFVVLRSGDGTTRLTVAREGSPS